jgi:hypothetical protein
MAERYVRRERDRTDTDGGVRRLVSRKVISNQIHETHHAVAILQRIPQPLYDESQKGNYELGS